MFGKVTYSVALAIRFMLDLTWHGESRFRTECPVLKPACWCNFLFFRRIVPKEIRRVKRVEATNDSVGHWIVERDIEFYLKGNKLMGVVTLRGKKLDRQKREVEKIRDYGLDVEDVLSMWAVSHVWYYRVVDTDLKDRIETDIPFSSYSCGQV